MSERTTATVDIPVTAGERIAKSYGYDQVVIVARKVGAGGREHVTTYGIDKVHCDVAARMGNFFKHKLMGWPAPEGHARDELQSLLDALLRMMSSQPCSPSRCRALPRRIQRLDLLRRRPSALLDLPAQRVDEAALPIGEALLALLAVVKLRHVLVGPSRHRGHSQGLLCGQPPPSSSVPHSQHCHSRGGSGPSSGSV